MKRNEKSKLWAERIQEFQTSGLTCKAWCMEHQIPLSTMTYWNRKLGEENTAEEGNNEPVFARLPSAAELISQNEISNCSAVSIFINDYFRIETSPSCPQELFQLLIRTLKENA